MSASFLLPQPAITVAAAKSTVHLMHIEIRGFIIASNQRRRTCRFT